MLVDSGSETNLISSQMLQEIGLSTSQIAITDQYNIKSSTEEVKNCILGKIEIKLELLLQSKDQLISNFARTKEQFLVAGPEVKFSKIILGNPFLGRHNMKLNFNPNSCRVSGSFLTETGYEKVNLSTKYKDKDFIISTNSTQISPGFSTVQFENNRIILENLSTKITSESKHILKMSEIVDLRPNRYLAYKLVDGLF